MDETCARFEHEWLHGDREFACQLAREYVAAHQQRLATAFERHTLESLVALIDSCRAAGHDEDRILADMWLLARFPAQRITGAMQIGGAAALLRATSQAPGRGESL